MTFEEYIRDIPLLHTWDDGKTWNSGGFNPAQLQQLYEFLAKNLNEKAKIIETGAGNSTITLTFLQPERHLVICPDHFVVQRINEFFKENKINHNNTEFIIDISEWQLPLIAAKTKNTTPNIDFGLIDGGHNWPTVFVDFFYINFMLREGGYILIDDIQLHSVKELGRLLAEEPGFELALDLGKSLVFRKISSARTLGEWNNSPYIHRLSEENMKLPDPFSLADAGAREFLASSDPQHKIEPNASKWRRLFRL